MMKISTRRALLPGGGTPVLLLLILVHLSDSLLVALPVDITNVTEFEIYWIGTNFSNATNPGDIDLPLLDDPGGSETGIWYLKDGEGFTSFESEFNHEFELEEASCNSTITLTIRYNNFLTGAYVGSGGDFVQLPISQNNSEWDTKEFDIFYEGNKSTVIQITGVVPQNGYIVFDQIYIEYVGCTVTPDYESTTATSGDSTTLDRSESPETTTNESSETTERTTDVSETSGSSASTGETSNASGTTNDGFETTTSSESTDGSGSESSTTTDGSGTSESSASTGETSNISETTDDGLETTSYESTDGSGSESSTTTDGSGTSESSASTGETSSISETTDEASETTTTTDGSETDGSSASTGATSNISETTDDGLETTSYESTDGSESESTQATEGTEANTEITGTGSTANTEPLTTNPPFSTTSDFTVTSPLTNSPTESSTASDRPISTTETSPTDSTSTIPQIISEDSNSNDMIFFIIIPTAIITGVLVVGMCCVHFGIRHGRFRRHTNNTYRSSHFRSRQTNPSQRDNANYYPPEYMDSRGVSSQPNFDLNASSTFVTPNKYFIPEHVSKQQNIVNSSLGLNGVYNTPTAVNKNRPGSKLKDGSEPLAVLNWPINRKNWNLGSPPAETRYLPRVRTN